MSDTPDPRPFHNNPRPEFPAPHLYGAIRHAWETLRDSGFCDEGGPLRNRHEFLQISELLTKLAAALTELIQLAHQQFTNPDGSTSRL